MSHIAKIRPRKGWWSPRICCTCRFAGATTPDHVDDVVDGSGGSPYIITPLCLCLLWFRLLGSISFVYIYIYTYMYICVYIYIYIYTHIHLSLSLSISFSLYACLSLHIHIYIYKPLYTYIYIYIYIYICIYGNEPSILCFFLFWLAGRLERGKFVLPPSGLQGGWGPQERDPVGSGLLGSIALQKFCGWLPEFSVLALESAHTPILITKQRFPIVATGWAGTRKIQLVATEPHRVVCDAPRAGLTGNGAL